VIGIAVELLTGRYVATAHHRRDQSEWPPHPARVFSALVAAWGDSDEPADNEADLLRTIEQWPAPQIVASQAHARTVPPHYVPVNDTSVLGLSLQQKRYANVEAARDQLAEAQQSDGGAAATRKAERVTAKIGKQQNVSRQISSSGRTPPRTARDLLPQSRPKQAREYPSVTPDSATVMFVWPDVDLDEGERMVLDELLQRVVRLGHSSSLVSCRVILDWQAARFVPDPAGELTLRAVGAGQFDALRRAYDHHQASDARSLPYRAVRYRDRLRDDEGTANVSASALSGDLLVLERTAGPRLPLLRTVDVAAALRATLMSYASEPIPEALSGHRIDEQGRSRPSQQPHAAFTGLPFVGHRYATGHLLGVAIVVPPDIDDASRTAIMDALARWRRDRDDELELRLGSAGVVQLTRVHDVVSAANLARATWAGPAWRWDSVTPIALGRHPGDLWGRSPRRLERAYDAATATVAQACGHVGLPAPSQVAVQLPPRLIGSRDAREFPKFVQGSSDHRLTRALVHARVEFAEPVVGPLLLGSGRYFGLGLMRPSRDPVA
jgi:CRISPR-associated protein Csb2